MALRDTGNTTLILLSADLYMLFANDLAVYHNLLRAAVGEAAYAQFRFVLASTHNHHVRYAPLAHPRARAPPLTDTPVAGGAIQGPDTSGLSGLNRDWYEPRTTPFPVLPIWDPPPALSCPHPRRRVALKPPAPCCPHPLPRVVFTPTPCCAPVLSSPPAPCCP